MAPIKVSYIVAVYNKESYLVECIDSILDESSDNLLIEVCVVDDGSSDYSLDILKNKYLSNDDVKIFSFDSNKGKNAAYNKAFTMSTGDYICVFGADDIVIKSRTRKLLNLSIKNNKSVYGNLISFNSFSSNINLNQQPLKNNKPNFYSNIMGNMIAGGSTLLIREHANHIFPLPEHLQFEDWWISYHLLKNDWIMAIDDSVTLYRIHENNDCAKMGDTYSTIRRDYLRHQDYLDEFRKIASSKKELKFIEKSRLLRNTFLGQYKLKELQYLSIDKYSLKTLSYIFLNPKKIYFYKDLSTRFLSKWD